MLQADFGAGAEDEGDRLGLLALDPTPEAASGVRGAGPDAADILAAARAESAPAISERSRRQNRTVPLQQF